MEVTDRQKLRTRILRVLLEDWTPPEGLPTRAIRDRVPGRHSAELMSALWELQAEGLLSIHPTIHRNRPAWRWALVNPSEAKRSLADLEEHRRKARAGKVDTDQRLPRQRH